MLTVPLREGAGRLEVNPNIISWSTVTRTTIYSLIGTSNTRFRDSVNSSHEIHTPFVL